MSANMQLLSLGLWRACPLPSDIVIESDLYIHVDISLLFLIIIFTTLVRVSALTFDSKVFKRLYQRIFVRLREKKMTRKFVKFLYTQTAFHT